MSKRRTRRRLNLLLSHRPQTNAQLYAWVKLALGLDVPRKAIVPGSVSPMTYLSHVYFERPQDLVVWANRGGGKTMLGAVATVLDLLFKPGVQVRILGGSLEQSSRMYEHVLTLLDRSMLAGLLKGTPTQRQVETTTGSRASILAQSQRSVRGVRVHKLRCDEVELFEPAVWDAAQLVTRSGDCGGVKVHGTVEAISTMHCPGGLMSQVVDRGTARLMKWTAMDVMGRCEPERACEGCALWGDCQGKAKKANGFVPVDDLLRQWKRSSRTTWASEMMCRRPTVRDRVFDGFDPTRHVREEVEAKGKSIVVGGMDFGYRNPTVVLWARIFGEGEGASVHVIDEYDGRQTTLGVHLDVVEARPWGKPAWIGIDPAGGQRNGQTGISDAQVMRQRGQTVRAIGSRIRDGIERIRRRLDHDQLHIHPRCRGLIEAIEAYHFDHEHPQREEPVKDGPDHWCDALRYLLVNLERGSGQVHRRDYLYGS